MIAVNWGSTNFRAWHVAMDGAVLAKTISSCGALSFKSSEFERALLTEVEPWIAQGETKILLCGMVGASKGWISVPYVPAPATFEHVAESCIRIDVRGLDMCIVPGLSGVDRDGVPEVMRGEETEIFGSCADLSGFDQVCLPGTHSKWVTATNGEITSFSTYMTGDLYQAIRSHTILNSFDGPQWMIAEDFIRGVERAKQGDSLSHHVFGTRTLFLQGRLRECATHAYLSGLLIGHEVKSSINEGAHVHLIGEPELCSLYSLALRAFGGVASIEPAGASVRGLLRFGREMEW